MNTRSNHVSWLTLLLLSAALGCGTERDADPAVSDDGTHRSQVAFQLPERDLIPEGICYDHVSGFFYLGSIQKNKILRISRDGAVDTFVPPNTGGLGGVIGMRVDAARRLLWANSDDGEEVEGAESGEPLETGIFKFNADDGTLIKKYVVEKEDKDHLFNDVAIARDGTVFITSFSKGMIYRIDSERDELEEYLQMPADIWNNGIDLSPDERFLFVVGNENIYRVEVETRELLELPIPAGDHVGYGDGLYFHDGSLIAITSWRTNDELENRVVRLLLSDGMDAITRIEVLDENHPLYSSPTTGAIVDDWFYYIATAQFGKFDEEGNLAPWDELSDTYILKLQIGGS